MPTTTPSWSIRLGLAGLLILALGIVWTAAHFRNADGSAFNPLRNFVSELGSPKSSRAAVVFNRSLIVSSPLIFAVVCAFGLRLRSRLGYAAIAVGFCALLGSTGVGFVSMDNLQPHLLAALLFFWGWLGTALLFTVGFWRGCTFQASPPVILAGLATLVFSSAFLAVLGRTIAHVSPSAFQNNLGFHRPLVWDLAVLEWCVVGSFYGWVLAAIAYLRRPAT